MKSSRQVDIFSCLVFHLLINATTILFGFSLANAGGFRLVDQDPYATARGNAFVASADRASALYYNPAAMVRLKKPAIHLGYHLVHFDADYHSFDGSRSTSNESEFLGPPQVYAVAPGLDGAVAVGVGLYSPFGLGLTWPKDTGFSSLTRESELLFLSTSPSIAVALSESFSVGASININYAKLDLSSETSPTLPPARLAIGVDGFAVGYSLGALWSPNQDLSFGLKYMSPTYMNLDGTMDVSQGGEDTLSSAETRFVLPDIITVGVAYQLSRNVNVELNYDWTNWDRIDSLDVAAETLPPVNFALNYSSASVVNFGASYALDRELTVLGGYYFSENISPDRNFNPAVPDIDKHYLSIGLSKKIDDTEFTLAYQYGFSGTREVEGSEVSPFGESGDGKYRVDIHAVAVSIQQSF